MPDNQRGFTLVELIVVMAIFITVVMITTSAFDNIVNKSSQQSKSVESQIQGVVGLEALRVDLEGAGFGLPWAINTNPPAATPVAYSEATSTNATTTSLFNDAPSNAPRAITSGPTDFNADASGASQYLVIKSTLIGGNDAAKKWTTVSFDSAGVKTPPRVWGVSARDFLPSDRVIVIKDSLMTTPPTRQLVALPTGVFSSAFSAAFNTYTTAHQNGDVFQIYGVDGSNDLRMPFNRADYYVGLPPSPKKMPQTCAPNTGLLYKSIISQANGAPSAGVPLLDCVADMQVVYGLDTSNNGFINSHPAAPPGTPAPGTATDLRNQLREIRIYILAQEGKKDRFYTYPSTTIDVGESFDNGNSVAGRRFNLATLIGPDYKYYRWKVYTIVVKPKNLIQ